MKRLIAPPQPTLWTPPAITPPRVLLPDGTDLASLELPERILCLSFWGPYDALVVDGDKPLETRGWEWPYPPGWLVVHSAQHVEKKVVKKYGIAASKLEPRGCYLGMVHVDGCRPLLPEDEPKAYHYAPNLFAWLLSRARRFPRPVFVDRGPQKFVYLKRELVVSALLASP